MHDPAFGSKSLQAPRLMASAVLQHSRHTIACPWFDIARTTGCRYPQEMRQQAKEASRKRAAGRRPPWYDRVQDLMAPFAAGL